MGFAMAKRLVAAGHDVKVYNRTRSKVEPLAELGAKVVDSVADLRQCDIVFTTVSASDDLLAVCLGPDGLITKGAPCKLVIDCSSVSEEASAQVRAEAKKLGVDMLAAPVSGNAKVVAAGKLTIVASGPRAAFDVAQPYLAALGVGVTYVGEGELARMVKICHNLLLGVVAQSLAEITVLAEKGGVPRHAFLEFINNSVMGSQFSRYKTPAFVNLDWTPTFTPVLAAQGSRPRAEGRETARRHAAGDAARARHGEQGRRSRSHRLRLCDLARPASQGRGDDAEAGERRCRRRPEEEDRLSLMRSFALRARPRTLLQ